MSNILPIKVQGQQLYHLALTLEESEKLARIFRAETDPNDWHTRNDWWQAESKAIKVHSRSEGPAEFIFDDLDNAVLFRLTYCGS